MLKKSILWDLVFISITICIVFYKFTTIPQHFAFDEVEFAKLALSLKDSPYLVYSSLATGHSTLYFYIILASFLLFGVSELALRLPAAIFGVLSVVVFYRLMRGLFEGKVIEILRFTQNDKTKKNLTLSIAVILALILATMRWYFNFARFAFEPTFLLFLELSSLYFVFKFVSSEKNRHLVLSAIFAGFAFHSYTPGRIFFVVPLLAVILFAKQKMRSGLLFAMTCFIVMLPLLFYLSRHPDIRLNQQMYLSNTELTVDDKIAFFSANAINNVKMLYVPGQGDANGRHNYPLKPATNPLLFGLFILGIGKALARPKNKTHLIFWLYLGVSFAPTLLTYPWENPNMLRTYTMIPGIVYFTGVGILGLFEGIKKHVKKPLLKNVAVSALLLLILLSLIYELRTYFYYQARDVIPHAFDVTTELK